MVFFLQKLKPLSMYKKILVFSILIIALSLSPFFKIEDRVYQVKSGDNITVIAENLKENNIIRSSKIMIIMAKIFNIKPKIGYYNTTKSLYSFLQKIDKADTKSGNITLIPGKKLTEYYQLLKKHKYIRTDKTLSEIMQILKISKPYEGRFLPQTYKFNYGDSATSILNRSYKLMNNRVEKIWKKFGKNKYINTKYKLIILASILEKESGNQGESSKIAGVFMNRLFKNMRLQADSTVVYALGDNYTGKLYKKDLKILSPNNTYKNNGLPVSAITSPSLASIISASKPEQHSFLYFVAKDKRYHIFAKTYLEHKINIKKIWH